MKFRCFAIFDEKAKAFLPPFFLPEIGMARRTFGDCVNDPQHQFSRHPSDYTLFHLADWDSNSGAFAVGAMELVMNGVQAVERPVLPMTSFPTPAAEVSVSKSNGRSE